MSSYQQAEIARYAPHKSVQVVRTASPHKFVTISPSVHKSSECNGHNWSQSRHSAAQPAADPLSSFQQLQPEQQQQREMAAAAAPAISRMSRIIEESVRQDSRDTAEGKRALSCN